MKNEDDALLAHEVAQKLIKSLVDYKMKTVHPHHSKSVSESIISYTIPLLITIKFKFQSLLISLLFWFIVRIRM